jgi:DNA-binding transcriptional regulator YdaS (Cro superfamily)
MAHKTGIQKALSLFEDSPTKLAASLGDERIKRQHVEHWLSAGRVPADKAPLVERATGIRCEELCPGVAWDVLRLQAGQSAKA